MNSAQLLPAIHDLYSRLPETYQLEKEAEIAAAVKVTQGDWPQWRAA